MQGDCLWYGLGLAIEKAEAKRLWRRGADLGDLQCLVRCNYYAVGCEENETETVRLLRLSLELWPSAFSRCFMLGECYENGNGVTVNYVEALRLYQLAADQGFAVAQNHIGFCYDQGACGLS